MAGSDYELVVTDPPEVLRYAHSKDISSAIEYSFMMEMLEKDDVSEEEDDRFEKLWAKVKPLLVDESENEGKIESPEMSEEDHEACQPDHPGEYSDDEIAKWDEECEREIAGSTGDSDDPTKAVCSAGEIKQSPEMENTLEGIRDSGNTFHYLYKTWAKMHSGDIDVGRGLLLSVGCQCIKNSKGIHICLTGDRGSGKSDAAKKMIKILPDEYTFDGSLSPKYLYGAGLSPGTTVLVDDMKWDSELGLTIKRVSTDYQTGSKRGTKGDMKSIEQETPARLTFWVTSVDSQADEQIRDRFLMKELDSSPERIAQIKTYMKKDAKGDWAYVEVSEDEIEMCKELIRDMKKHEFEVVIPFADRIETAGDTRALRIFLDMVMSHAVFHYALRSKDEKDRLIATEEDFQAAKYIFEDFGGHSADKYSGPERKVLQAIIDSGYAATTDQILKEADISGGRLSQIMHGRGDRDQQQYGLLHKCKGLDSRKDKNGTNIYTLPRGFTLDDGVEQVKLLPESRIILGEGGQTTLAATA